MNVNIRTNNGVVTTEVVQAFHAWDKILFIHKEIDSNNYTVSEMESGLGIVPGAASIDQESALYKTLLFLKRKGKTRFLANINEAIRKHGAINDASAWKPID